jgi:outer membrane protein OmpA-like peptidoglycan-associated protein/Tol biopolymer transport system component
MIRVFHLLLFLFLSLATWAQRGGTSDGKASRLYEEGRQHKKFGRIEYAEAAFLKALERDPNFLDAMYELSELYMQSGNIDASKQWMKTIVEQNPTYASSLIVTLALIAQQEENYHQALSYFEKYMGIAPPGSNNYLVAQRGAASCEFAIWAMEHPVPFDPVNLGPNVNSANDEYFPAMTADEQLLIYTREIAAPNNPYSPDGLDEDFYFSEKQADGTWGPAYNPGPPINSAWREGAPTISPDGKYIIFTICDLYGQYAPDRSKTGFGSCDLFVSVRHGKSWSPPLNMGKTINSRNWESQPCFSADGKTLYFVRGRYNQERERLDDIYYSELLNGKWTEAQPLPPNINSPEDEESVFLHPDNQTMYFSSRGHLGLGMMDIFMSRRQEDGSWGDPVNLGYPINTSGHENSFFVSANGKYAIIASNREGGEGKLDLYSFELPEHLRPIPVTYLKGKITDAAYDTPLEATFRLINLETGDTVVSATSDKSNGNYLVVLPTGENYALMAERNGYLYHSEHFTLDRTDELTEFTKNIALQPISAGSSVILKNVFFDTDQYDLKPASKTELERLKRLLADNPSIRIEIGGHTDNQGSAAANQTLSLNRAKAVYDYLVNAGVEAPRLSYNGYGQTVPIASNDTDSGRAQNRRTEFRILP